MSKKSITIVIIAIAILAIGVGIWKWESNKKAENIKKQEIVKREEIKREKQNFVIDVDLDVSQWQTKETEFFTIKFPKEWYWLKSVVANNSDFDMDKFADIGVFSAIGPRSPLILSNDTEIVISFKGTATSDAGTPQDSIDAIFELAKKNNPSVDCNILNNKIIPFTAYCSATYNSQLQQSYYVINSEISLTITTRTTRNTLVKKEILDKIVGNIILKQSI